ncbi:MAG TPA: type VI secretion system baseplate subunit TssK [Rhodopila sp.]|uniref:type VI secretion system baseplate subunit TssK n=1 Tax=Rhodopila sp. TaxID=2480087 RepID=UPI002C3643E5|nr:type VI secretion system baseplate subunit TssK [Rhodopila sp.]HVY16446.1 type VI secretion system baseplate subunit TssK [Rhodopila sp.]
MAWENKVVWGEGLFLQPQHLQQQERYLERVIRGATGALTPFSYGLTHLSIDTDLLALGKFAVRSAAGVLPDGTPFHIPDDTDHPPTIDVPETVKNAIVYLVLPSRLQDAVDTVPPDRLETAARYSSGEREVIDTTSDNRSVATVPIAKLRIRYALEHESRAGHVSVGLAMVVEVRPDKAVVLDEAYIPPVMTCGVSSLLAGFLTQLQGLLHHRAEALAGRVSDSATRGAAEISDYLILQICNRYEPLITHLAAANGQIHPESLYRVLLSLAGELATFTETRKRPPVFPPYRHDDLNATFRPVIAALRQALSTVISANAVPIPLQERKYGIRVGPIPDRSLVTDATWVLVVKAQVPPETLRRGFPNQVKIGPVEQIAELITAALPGIAVAPLPVVPRQLPYYAGRSYFELDRSGPYWQALARSGGIAVHVAGDLPGLEMECWAIRG